jgi:hypothetical protein
MNALLRPIIAITLVACAFGVLRSGRTGGRQRRHADEMLDEALDESFPASDPPSTQDFDIPVNRR